MGIGTTKKPLSDVPVRLSGIGTRISACADILGTRKSAASAMGVSVDALQRYIREDNMPAFDAVARLCAAAHVRMEWVATGEGPERLDALQGNESQVARPDLAMLASAVEVLDRALDQAGATTINPAGHAELLVAVYELLEQGAAMDAAQRVVSSMLRALSHTT